MGFKITSWEAEKQLDQTLAYLRQNAEKKFYVLQID